jgi:MFS family permease
MGIVQFIAAIYSMTCLTKVKRRPMVLIGNLLMGICSLGMGIVYLFQKSFPNGFWIVVALIFVYMTVHGGTLIPGVWLYVSEIADRDQPKYSSVTNWFMCSVTVVIFPIVNARYGYAPMFITFGVISIILFIVNFFLMFETK